MTSAVVDGASGLFDFQLKVGFPATIRVGQGSEFVSRDLWAISAAPRWSSPLSRLGKPTDNVFIQPSTAASWPECLNAQWFMPLVEAQEMWRLGAIVKPASEYPSGYAIDEKRFRWLGGDPAGALGLARPLVID
ncbi:hypothetical protein [Bradyrhizobium sp. USDA 4486]